MRHACRICCMLGVALVGTFSTNASGQTVKSAKASRPTVVPVPGYVRAKGEEREITIVGRAEDNIIFVLGNKPVGVRRSIAAKDIEAIAFDLRYEPGHLDLAVRLQEWDKAIRMLLPVVSPLLPYLDLENNNGAELVLQVGDYMMRSADVKSRVAKTDAEKEQVDKLYRTAYTVLRYGTRAEWSKVGTLSALKSCKCLLALQKPKTSRQLFDKIIEPVPGDAAYGLYWLVKAELEAEKGEWRPAMDAAVKSLCFENKDIDTFPDALMISARCYEELQEWYRARDVYYEVARLFPSTDWSRNATERLKFIMGEELTKEEEKAPIETIFFALKDDMNKLVTDLLEGRVSTDGKKKKGSVMKTPRKKKSLRDQIKDELGSEGDAPPEEEESPREKREIGRPDPAEAGRRALGK